MPGLPAARRAVVVFHPEPDGGLRAFERAVAGRACSLLGVGPGLPVVDHGRQAFQRGVVGKGDLAYLPSAEILADERHTIDGAWSGEVTELEPVVEGIADHGHVTHGPEAAPEVCDVAELVDDAVRQLERVRAAVCTTRSSWSSTLAKPPSYRAPGARRPPSRSASFRSSSHPG